MLGSTVDEESYVTACTTDLECSFLPFALFLFWDPLFLLPFMQPLFLLFFFAIMENDPTRQPLPFNFYP